MEFHFHPPEQRRMDSGQIVTTALQSMGGRGRANDLLKLISYQRCQETEHVEPLLKQVLRRGIESGFLIKRGTTYQFTASPQYQIDSDRKRSRSRSGSRSDSKSPPSPKSSPSAILSRRMKTPYRRSRGSNASSARLASINQRLKDEEAEESARARTSYRQPKNSPKRKKIKFALTPESARKRFRSRTPGRASASSPEISPPKIRKLKFDDDEDDVD